MGRKEKTKKRSTTEGLPFEDFQNKKDLDGHSGLTKTQGRTGEGASSIRYLNVRIDIQTQRGKYNNTKENRGKKKWLSGVGVRKGCELANTKKLCLLREPLWGGGCTLSVPQRGFVVGQGVTRSRRQGGVHCGDGSNEKT